jgi:hypothetical protein
MAKDTRLSLDEAVEYLRANPEQITRAWSCFDRHPAGALFQFVSPSGRCQPHDCGCPTLIKAGDIAIDKTGAEDAYLTSKIRRFHIPEKASKIVVKDLPKFAKIQKMVDDYYKERGWRK